MDATAPKKRILILGGGFGGVSTAYHLERLLRGRPDVEIVLVSRDNFVLMTPLLFEVFSGSLDLRGCSVPIRAFLRSTRFVEAAVEGIDLDRRVVHLAPPGEASELAYDQLVLALGSRTNRAMIPGSEHAFTFKTLADALLLRNHVIERFERADVETDPRRKAQLLTFVVVGGGLVGVELLGELTAFVDGIAPFYEHVDRGEVRFLLLQGGDRIMPEIDPKLAEYGARVLAGRRGVELRTRTRVRAIEPGKVHLADETIAADTIVLAAGTVPDPVVAGLPVEKDRSGRVVVEATMRCPEPPGGVGAGRLCRDPRPGRQAVPRPGAARPARGPGAGREHRRRAGRPAAPAVRLPHPGDDGLPGPRQGVRPAPGGAGARVPGVVRPPHLLPAANARLGPEAADRDRLDPRPAVPAGRRQDRPGQRDRLAPVRGRTRRCGRMASGRGRPNRVRHRRRPAHPRRLTARPSGRSGRTWTVPDSSRGVHDTRTTLVQAGNRRPLAETGHRMDPQIVSLVSVCTALVASIAGPLATLRVSRRQFSATVLSTGRQKWIDSLRDLLADLMSQLAGLSVIKGGWTGEWNGGLGLLHTDPSLVAKVERLVLVRWKIRLMLNLNEADHQELDQLIGAAVQRLRNQSPARPTPMPTSRTSRGRRRESSSGSGSG